MADRQLNRSTWTIRLIQCAIAAMFFMTAPVAAKPSAPADFCAQYPEAAACQAGAVDCSLCHASVPRLNTFGTCFSDAITEAGGSFDNDFASVLGGMDNEDCDGDLADNLAEYVAGTDPGDAASKPAEPAPGDDGDDDAADLPESCEDRSKLAGMNLCGFDPVFAFVRVSRDFCGVSPDYVALSAFKQMSAGEQDQALHGLLDACLDSEFWIGKDGVVWSLAHPKIAPLQTIKSGEGGGTIPLGDYDDDYNIFVYHHIDGRDVRGILTADYYVMRDDVPTNYYEVDSVPMHPEAGGVVRLVGAAYDNTQQWIPRGARAGLLTTTWNSTSKTMFTSIPRSNAANAMRAFLDIDIAKAEGLTKPNDPSFELVDHDSKGVDHPDCAYCHEVLDPATYPFNEYNGLSFSDPTGNVNIGDVFDPDSETSIPFPRIARALAEGNGNVIFPGIYKPARMNAMANIAADTEPNLAATPTAGYLMGQPVANLVEWAQVAANSPEFAQKTVKDYWQLLVGRAPAGADAKEFEDLWRGLMDTDGYSVEAMLHRLIKTEAYGAP